MISIIAALTKDRVIGLNGALPWDIPDELKQFRERTKGNTVIMGRKTYESIGKPLPNRNNIVISSQALDISGVTVCRSMHEAIALARTFGKEIFIIGGAGIFKEGLDFADRLILSFVRRNYAGDTFFPEFDREEWNVKNRENYPDFELVIYERNHGPTHH